MQCSLSLLVDPCERARKRVALVAAGMAERVRRRVRELVRECARKLVHHALRVFASREPALCALDLVAARALGRVAHRTDRRHDLAAAEPLHEVAYVSFDDYFGLR